MAPSAPFCKNFGPFCLTFGEKSRGGIAPDKNSGGGILPIFKTQGGGGILAIPPHWPSLYLSYSKHVFTKIIAFKNEQIHVRAILSKSTGQLIKSV